MWLAGREGLRGRLPIVFVVVVVAAAVLLLLALPASAARASRNATAPSPSPSAKNRTDGGEAGRRKPRGGSEAGDTGDDGDGRDGRDAGRNGSVAVVATTCEGFRLALLNESVSLVAVDGDLTCSRKAWASSVVITRQVEVLGRPIANSSSSSSPPSTPTDAGTPAKRGLPAGSINWGIMSRAVEVKSGGSVAFRDVTLLQEDMGIGGLDLPFVHSSGTGARVELGGVVVIVRSCPLPISVISDIATRLPRPDGRMADQEAQALGKQALLVVDMAVPRGEGGKAVWRICNTVFRCGKHGARDSTVEEYFMSGKLGTLCRETPKNNTEPLKNNDAADADADDNQDNSELGGEEQVRLMGTGGG